jgi:hypothetical protein
MKGVNQKKDIEHKVVEEIIKAIQEISYGEVAVTIHNSKVVQIERKEKKRFSSG